LEAPASIAGDRRPHIGLNSLDLAALTGFIQKPYTATQLAQKVRDALNAPQLVSTPALALSSLHAFHTLTPCFKIARCSGLAMGYGVLVMVNVLSFFG
jgi:hypothetical protein